MKQQYPEYEDLVQMFQDGNITTVDFVCQQSDDLTDEYDQFCKNEGLDRDSDSAARAFMDYRADLFEESITD
ncbi:MULTISPECIES: hypothetical protein [Bacteroidales]|jgi:hypothetical protein|uniref:hypothetical protein n=1 Tax=Bacteroidales TaxID=171549 RepID=UPI001551CB5B|nr:MULTISPECIES: hypothetical protein [Bacteroidales]NPE37639.1 hypothetical protein [Prevotella sp. PCJ2]